MIWKIQLYYLMSGCMNESEIVVGVRWEWSHEETSMNYVFNRGHLQGHKWKSTCADNFSTHPKNQSGRDRDRGGRGGKYSWMKIIKRIRSITWVWEINLNKLRDEEKVITVKQDKPPAKEIHLLHSYSYKNWETYWFIYSWQTPNHQKPPWVSYYI